MQGVNIYTEEGAWTGFRWGPTPGTFYDNTQFPKDYVEAYIKQIQPAYRNLPASAVQVENNAMRVTCAPSSTGSDPVCSSVGRRALPMSCRQHPRLPTHQKLRDSLGSKDSKLVVVAILMW